MIAILLCVLRAFAVKLYFSPKALLRLEIFFGGHKGRRMFEQVPKAASVLPDPFAKLSAPSRIRVEALDVTIV